MDSRIYLVDMIGEERPKAPTTLLVEATSAAQALRHVAKRRFTVRAASPKDVRNAMQDGASIEDATKAGE